MSQEYCNECGESYSSDEVFHIKIFNRNWTKWCFNCATQQLKWSDYKLVKRGNTKRDIHIQSVEEWGKEQERRVDELEICYEEQFCKIPIGRIWGELHQIAQYEWGDFDN